MWRTGRGKRGGSCVLFVLLAGLHLPAWAGIYVIVHQDSPIRELSIDQVAAIALGRPVRFEEDVRPGFVDQSTTKRVFHEFHYRITSMSELQLNSHWARQVFTGRARRPRRLGDDEAVLHAVESDADLVGYLTEAPAADRRVRVVFTLEDLAKP